MATDRAGERADAIPERFHLHDKLATSPCTCDCAQCRAGQCSLKRPLRAAQPEAGNEESERLREDNERRVLVLAKECDEARAEAEHLRERVASLMLDEPSKTAGLYAAIDELQREVERLRAAHPEADRAPEDER